MTPEEKSMYIALDSVLVTEISKATPGKGRHVANAWDIEFSDGDFYLVNNYGMIAKYLDEGVSPHKILPKNSKMLRFEIHKSPVFREAKSNELWNKNGKIFFFNKQKQPVLGFVREGSKIYCLTKKVMHPGYKGRQYIQKVLNDKKIWSNVLAEYLKGK